MADENAQPVQVEQAVQPEQPQVPQEQQQAPEPQQAEQPQQAQQPAQQGVNNGPADAPASNGLIYDTYSSVIANPWVQTAFNTYGWAKQQNSYLESTLNSVEQKALDVASAAGQKATQTYETYYVRPRDAVAGVYNTNVERGRWAFETGKTAAYHTGTISVGAAVLASQLGMGMTAGGAGYLLDGVSACQGAGVRTLDSAKQMQQVVEEKIWNAVGEVQRVAKVPVDKAAETTHSILDVIRAMCERTLNIEITSNPEDSIRQRVTTIAYAIVSALSTKAHEQILDPVSARTKDLLDSLGKSIIIVDLVRAKREWAMEKVETLSNSVSDLKVRLETEAKAAGAAPEEILMKYIRKKAVDLKDQLEKLKEKGQQVFGNGTRIEAAITYLQTFDTQLENAQDIYEVSDAVLIEARQTLGGFREWTTDLISGRK